MSSLVRDLYLSASVVSERGFVVSDPIAFMVEEFGEFRRPTDLHHARRHHFHLVIPNTYEETRFMVCYLLLPSVTDLYE